MALKDVLLAVFVACIWGATFPLSAIALDGTPPIFFTFLRFSCAGAFVLIVPRPNVPWKALILLGLLLGVGQFGLMFISMTRGISAGLASLLIHTQALITIVIAMMVFSERLSKRQVFAIVVALSGLAVLVFERAEGGALDGFLLILLAATCGACCNNILKSFGKVDMLRVSVWMSVVAPLPLFLLSVIFEVDGSVGDLFATISWVTIGAVVYSAVPATVLAFAFWGRLFTTYSAALVAPFFLLVPVFGISLSALTLGESLSTLQISGVVLVFCGLVLAVWPKRQMI